jgi:hypothetical protein
MSATAASRISSEMPPSNQTIISLIIRAVLHQQIEKADTPLPVSMTWLVGPLLDCTVAIMACGSSRAIVPRTERIPVDGCQLPQIFQWR